MIEIHDIRVRAHTIVSQKESRPNRLTRSAPAKWPDEILVFDTETTIDSHQELTFGAFRRCKLSSDGYVSVSEGLFHSDDLAVGQLDVLKQFVEDPQNSPQLSTKIFPPPIRIGLLTRSEFIERVFWKSIRQGAMVVGFNLPFDLSRLASKSCRSKDGGWSLILSLRKNRETGEIETNIERPRVVITAIDSKMAFISVRDIYRPEEWPIKARFLDLRTLGWALRNSSFSLESGCKSFGVPGKMIHKPTGTVCADEIKYCVQDVRATTNLLNAMKKEFDQHPIALLPDKAYSPASIAKAYLDSMNIARPKKQSAVSNKELGIAMQAYYGGRAEARIRKTSVPVVLTDFTSQYPTVNALLGNFELLTAETISFEDCTEEVKEMLASTKLEDTFSRYFWRKLPFFALVEPDHDVLPVRTVYNGRTQNIGLNHLSSEKPIWFAGPDVVAASLLCKPPKIVKAIRLVSNGKQQKLRGTNLAGMVAIDPVKDDFYRHVIEQKSLHKSTNRGLANFLKTVANSGSYGLFVQLDSEDLREPTDVQVFSGEQHFERPYSVVEKSGPWYFPPLASLITAGGRLLLAMLERKVTDAGGAYLFCDTDSLCIVSSERSGYVPCEGGPYKLQDGTHAIKSLSWKKVDQIADSFNQLNPFNPKLVKNILKIEDVNYVDSDPGNQRRQVFGYAISAKRYALYTRTENDICVVKASAHGLGYLYPPKDGFDEGASAPQWVSEAWDWLLRLEFGLRHSQPSWITLPAMMRVVLTSPNVLRDRQPEWLRPFNFFFLPVLSELSGYPAGFDPSSFKFIVPFSTDRKNWGTLSGINLCDGQNYEMEMFPNGKQDKVVAETFQTILRLYFRRPEAKSLAPDGSRCVSDTRGLLKRASIIAGEIIPVGKETDRRWEQGEDLSLLDFAVQEYRSSGDMVVANAVVREQLASWGTRGAMRRTGLHQHTIEGVKTGRAVRRSTLKRILKVMG